MTPAQVDQIDPPADVRALSTLPAIDYADSFTVRGAGERTPERWARAMLADAPPRIRFKLVAGWTFLGLRLGIRPRAERILGWRIRRRTPDVLLLGAGSRLGLPAELLFRREPDGVLFATFVRQRSRLARALWPRVIPGHQRIVASLLAHGADRILSSSEPQPRLARAGRRMCAETVALTAENDHFSNSARL